MTNKEMYSRSPGEWPRWLDETDQERLLKAARSGADAERDTLIIATMMYLGLSAREASKISVNTVFEDAIEDRKRGAFLHIPNEYKKIVLEIVKKKENFSFDDRLIQCTMKDAESAVTQAFQRAGIDIQHCFMRLKRTAAHLHYNNEWTPIDYIERWFYEIGFIKNFEISLYYRDDKLNGFALTRECLEREIKKVSGYDGLW